MADTDSATGRLEARFPTTLWSGVLAARDAERPDVARPHLDELFRRYWKPVYSCVRLFWGASSEDAKDCVQEFFISLLEREAFASVDPSRGSFRSYLKACLRHFMLDRKKHAAAAKRSAAAVSLEANEAELEKLLADSRGETPEASFDRAWLICVMKQAFARVAEELAREGRGHEWSVFQAHDLDGPEVTYDALATRLGLSPAQVKLALKNVRRRVRKILREIVAEYCGSEAEARREFAELFPDPPSSV